MFRSRPFYHRVRGTVSDRSPEKSRRESEKVSMQKKRPMSRSFDKTSHCVWKTLDFCSIYFRYLDDAQGFPFQTLEFERRTFFAKIIKKMMRFLFSIFSKFLCIFDS